MHPVYKIGRAGFSPKDLKIYVVYKKQHLDATSRWWNCGIIVTPLSAPVAAVAHHLSAMVTD